jgi:hypothetical protein
MRRKESPSLRVALGVLLAALAFLPAGCSTLGVKDVALLPARVAFSHHTARVVSGTTKLCATVSAEGCKAALGATADTLYAAASKAPAIAEAAAKRRVPSLPSAIAKRDAVKAALAFCH